MVPARGHTHTHTHTPSRLLGKLSIDKSFSWGFFDGAFQGPKKICGPGGVLYILDDHVISIKENICRGSNNLAELEEVKTLLKITWDLDIQELHVFMDSFMVVN